MTKKSTDRLERDAIEKQQADIDAHVPGTPIAITLPGIDQAPLAFTISPLRVKQFFPFLKSARPIFAALASRASPPTPDLPPEPSVQGQGSDPIATPATPAHGAIATGATDAQWMINLVEEHGPAVIHTLAVGLAKIATDQDAWDKNIQETEGAIEELTIVDLFVLLNRFVEVNASFFVARGLTLPQVLNIAKGVQSQGATESAIR